MNSLSEAPVRPFSHGLAYLASSPIPRFSVVETVARPGVGPAFPPIVIQGRRQGPSSGEPAPLPELLQLRPPSCSLLCQVTHQSLPLPFQFQGATEAEHLPASSRAPGLGLACSGAPKSAGVDLSPTWEETASCGSDVSTNAFLFT